VDGRDFSSFSDEEISALVDETHLNGANINLGVPFQQETVAFFMKIFTCRKCGACCRGEGFAESSGVMLDPEEVGKLAEEMAVLRSRFKKDFTYIKEGRRILRYPCPFHDEGSRSCRIYARRPGVCRNFPIHAPLPIGGTYTLVVAGTCPEGRRVAVEFLKIRRDIEISLKRLEPGEREKIAGISRRFWDFSEMEQQKSGRLKKIN
jgi:Fe-S-cluster containining protein